MNQRWLFRRDSYRPTAEPINTAAHEVAKIDDDTTPKAFVLTHHYSGSYPAARRRFGLYKAAQPSWSTPRASMRRQPRGSRFSSTALSSATPRRRPSSTPSRASRESDYRIGNRFPPDVHQNP